MTANDVLDVASPMPSPPKTQLTATKPYGSVGKKATSVVFGMPQAAQRLGAAGEVLGLGQIHGAIRSAVARLVR